MLEFEDAPPFEVEGFVEDEDEAEEELSENEISNLTIQCHLEITVRGMVTFPFAQSK